MFRHIEVSQFRGLREGTLSDLTGLTILVGRNGSAKSTILDALLVGAARAPGDAIGHIVRRRLELRNAVRWLLWKGQEGRAQIAVSSEAATRRWLLDWSREAQPSLRKRLAERGSEGPYSELLAQLEGTTYEVHVGVAADGSYEVVEATLLPDRGNRLFNAWMIDSRTGSHRLSLERVYSRAASSGRKKQELERFVAEVVPELQSLDIQAEEDGSSVLHMTFQDRSVPVAMAGDGIHSMVRLCCELVASEGGMLLLEEPEVHQHPGAMLQSAKAIHRAVRRGIQVILTTHSMDFVDALVAAAEPVDVAALCLFRLRVDDGKLLSSRLDGEQVAEARGQISEDLR
jgi:predicted ATPase